MKTSSRSVQLWFLVFVATLAAALLLPRFVPSGEQGLAAGATAAMVFFALAGVAVVVAIVLLWMTLRSFPELTGGARAAGLLPIPLLLLAAMLFWKMVQQKRAEAENAAPSPATTTPGTPTAPPANP